MIYFTSTRSKNTACTNICHWLMYILKLQHMKWSSYNQPISFSSFLFFFFTSLLLNFGRFQLPELCFCQHPLYFTNASWALAFTPWICLVLFWKASENTFVPSDHKYSTVFILFSKTVEKKPTLVHFRDQKFACLSPCQVSSHQTSKSFLISQGCSWQDS